VTGASRFHDAIFESEENCVWGTPTASSPSQPRSFEVWVEIGQVISCELAVFIDLTDEKASTLRVLHIMLVDKCDDGS